MLHFKTLVRRFALIIFTFVLCSQFATAQTRVIELQVTVDPRAAIGTQQAWLETLAEVGADRVVLKTGSDGKPQIEETQSPLSTIILVNGSIKNNRLSLPGGTFSIRDQASIKALIKKLRDDGATVALAEKKAFGLTSEQLVGVHETLSRPLDFSTVDLTAAEVVEKISAVIGRDLVFQGSVKSDRLADNRGNLSAPVTQELNGISAGTALAIVLRPHGLVLQPQRPQGKSLQLKIIAADANQEFWPVGWPLEQPPVQVEPKLFETLALEIRGFSLKDTLAAIESRSGVLFFYDQQAITTTKLNLADVKVTLVEEKISYMVAVGRLLRQSKPRLIEELRVDDAGKPFLWITVK